MSDPVQITDSEAYARLDIVTHPCEGCQEEIDQTGIANHGPDHGERRRTIHSMLGGLGADWDATDVLLFLERADKVIEVPPEHWMFRTGHRVAAHGKFDESSPPRWYAFETKR